MITDYKEFCRRFYATTLIPLTYYHVPTKEICSFPSYWEKYNIFRKMLSGFTLFSENPGYYISPSFSCFGCVKSLDEEHVLYVGPLFGTPYSDFTLRSFMKEYAISPEHREEVEALLSNAPAVSFHRFLETLAYLHLCVNDQSLDINMHFHLNDTSNIQARSGIHSNRVFEAKENQDYHNTYHFERQLMQMIQSGNTEKVKELLKDSATLSAGTMASNVLRQEKNIFISAIALAMRSAVAGGMDTEQAYHLADIYIQECENSSDISYITNLEYSMCIDFSERVAQNKIPQGMSQEIFECIQYITYHINEVIRVKDVADYIGKSRSYLSGRFKTELGFDISDFIMQCKLEEAKSLLRYSDKTLSEISNYLCFSSQSYFQNVFKKKYNLTPKQYRDKFSTVQS
ncbi:MAG: helix-turn-helix domain-containing protein [Eubacterium sp.]|nr:helix-turn-helix domain-containing protein [Eubacterium sp.]